MCTPRPTRCCADAQAHLCATTDVQGRQVNGAADSCRATGPPQRSTGRFIHVEQSSAARSHAALPALIRALEELAARAGGADAAGAMPAVVAR